MRRILIGSIVLLALAAVPHSSANGSRRPSSRHHDFRSGRLLTAFDAIYGVDGPFLGDAFAIRGVVGDEAPWEVAEVHGTLDTEGHLTIVVRGLVFKDDPSVPPELRGKNDEAEFRGLVSCETEDGDQVATRNVVTRGFRATTTGNSVIRATVDLPNPCVAPIVMVLAGSEDKWFAVTGFESPE